MNKVIIIGHLARSIELKYTQSQMAKKERKRVLLTSRFLASKQR